VSTQKKAHYEKYTYATETVKYVILTYILKISCDWNCVTLNCVNRCVCVCVCVCVCLCVCVCVFVFVCVFVCVFIVRIYVDIYMQELPNVLHRKNVKRILQI
jgi:hypothetical protein